MHKELTLNITFDRESLRLLDRIAAQETEGIRSMAIRRLVRQEARARGWQSDSETASVPV